MSRRHLVMLLALSSIWGASFLFIKVGVRELEPATLIWVRVGLAALALVPVALVALGGHATVTGATHGRGSRSSCWACSTPPSPSG